MIEKGPARVLFSGRSNIVIYQYGSLHWDAKIEINFYKRKDVSRDR